MWRVFCSHVVDVENDYFVKDGLVEDLIEEFGVEFGEDDDDCDSDEEEELIDDKDRRLIDNALHQTTLIETLFFRFKIYCLRFHILRIPFQTGFLQKLPVYYN